MEFEKVELDMETKEKGEVSRRHNRQIVREKNVNTPMSRHRYLEKSRFYLNLKPRIFLGIIFLNRNRYP